MIALLIAGLLIFIFAAAGTDTGRFNLTAAGLACWVASALVTQLRL